MKKTINTRYKIPTKLNGWKIFLLTLCTFEIYLLHSSHIDLGRCFKKDLEIKFLALGELSRFFHPAIELNLDRYKLRFEYAKPLQFPKETDIVSLRYSEFGLRFLSHAKLIIMIMDDPWLNREVPEDCRLIVIHCAKNKPRTMYFPLWVYSFQFRRRSQVIDLIDTNKDWESILMSKKHFCAFMYSHDSHARDELYDILSMYKEVHSLGRAKSQGAAESTFDRFTFNDSMTYMDLAVEKYRKYKFVIAGENTINLEGYVTEKIVNVMLADSIPIYIGAPDIEDHFNPKSFINANKLTTEDLLATIINLDQNQQAYAEMLRQPWFKDNKIPDWFNIRNQSELFQIADSLLGLR